MGSTGYESQLMETLVQTNFIDGLAPPLQIALFLTALAFLSAALVCVTAFTRIVIVLSFVRRALTTQEIPPNQVVIGLAMFMTMFIMGPTIDAVFEDAVVPYRGGDTTMAVAVERSLQHLHEFMLYQTRVQDIALFIELGDIEAPQTPADTPMRVLIPAFIVSELKTAFIMGFCIYVPFLLVDLVVSTMLMALGMMMMPPAMMSLPVKILLFVLVDGWTLVMRALSMSFG